MKLMAPVAKGHKRTPKNDRSTMMDGTAKKGVNTKTRKKTTNGKASKVIDESSEPKKVVGTKTSRERSKCKDNFGEKENMSIEKGKRKYHTPGPDEETRGTEQPVSFESSNPNPVTEDNNTDLPGAIPIRPGAIPIRGLGSLGTGSNQSEATIMYTMGADNRNTETCLQRVQEEEEEEEQQQQEDIEAATPNHEQQEQQGALDAWVVKRTKHKKKAELVQANVDLQTSSEMSPWIFIFGMILVITTVVIVLVFLLVVKDKDENLPNDDYLSIATDPTTGIPSEQQTTTIPSTTLLPTEGEGTSPPTEPLMFEPPSERLEIILDILKTDMANFMGRNISGLDNPRSPQYRAAKWLADVDEFIETNGLADVDNYIENYLDNSTIFWEMDAFATRFGLATFYYATGGEDWTSQCNFLNTTAHHCEWNCPVSDIVQQAEVVPGYWDFSVADLLLVDSTVGVKCIKYILEVEPGLSDHVFSLDLIFNGLSGTIPEDFGLYTNPFRLTLAYHDTLSGSIPFDSFPPWFALLYLPYNDLEGGIPSSVERLTSLVVFWAFNNELEGPLPTQIGNLTNLENLDISNNLFNSTIPTEIQSLTKLNDLVLRDNLFSGTIPSSIFYELTNLLLVDLDDNTLSGPLPEFSPATSNLILLNFHGNKLDGTIPSSIGTLTVLSILELADNNLTGSVPETIQHLSNLASINLATNLLNGTVLQDGILSGLSKLTSLSLWDNNFSGSIGADIDGLTALKQIFIFENQFSGPLPSTVGQLVYLESLDLSYNAFTGSIPSTLLNLINLKRLSVERTDLTGSVESLCAQNFDLYQGQGVNLLFSADCDEVLCPCCTVCCYDSNPDECSNV